MAGTRTDQAQNERNKANLSAFIAGQITELDKRTISMMSYVGEQAVKEARRRHSYTDRTGNLTSSMGYSIVDMNGNKHLGQFVQSKATADKGSREGEKVANDRAGSIRQKANTYTLVVVAGMDYAPYVSAKYNVLQSSERVAKELFARFTKRK